MRMLIAALRWFLLAVVIAAGTLILTGASWPVVLIPLAVLLVLVEGRLYYIGFRRDADVRRSRSSENES